ncbi:hypothetical protein L249_1683, partial [Ophiocordyceps polyrhachis-furcata BCC 54312]
SKGGSPLSNQDALNRDKHLAFLSSYSRGGEYSGLGRFRPGRIGTITVSPGALSGGAADGAMPNEKERKGTKEEDLLSQ